MFKSKFSTLIGAAAVAAIAPVVLSAGEAKALLTCTFSNFSGCNQTLGNATFSGFNVSGTGFQATDELQISQVGDIYEIFADYTPGGTRLTGSGQLSFLITLSDGRFTTGQSDTIVGAGTGNFNFTSTLSGLGSPLLNTNTSTDGPKPFASSVSATSVLISWDQNSSTRTAFSSILSVGTEVPGPLPLLGAASAFGFSRRMRQRIKARA